MPGRSSYFGGPESPLLTTEACLSSLDGSGREAKVMSINTRFAKVALSGLPLIILSIILSYCSSIVEDRIFNLVCRDSMVSASSR